VFELFKLFWDVVVIRDAARKGHKMSTGIVLRAIGFVVLLYVILLPATVLYQNHPQYKPVFIAALVLDGILAMPMFMWAMKWWLKQRAARATGSGLAGRSGQ
jgi:hypothetical protein